MRFDARTGAPRSGPVPINRAGSTPLMITSDGRRLVAVGKGETVVRDAQSLRALKRWPVGGRGASQYWPAALSPDDRTVAIGGEDGSVRLLDLETGEEASSTGPPCRRGLRRPLHARWPHARHHRRGQRRDPLGRAARDRRRNALRATRARRSRPRSHATAGPSTRPGRAPRYSSGTSPEPGASAGRSAPARPAPSPDSPPSRQVGPSSRSAPTAA